MSDLQLTLLLTLMAGIAMPVGALLARIERIHPNWLEQEFRHTVIAFGAGALLCAVALVLVPEGTESLSIPAACISFISGALTLMGLDIWLSRRKTSASQLVAMLSDFLPEAIALGATLVSSPSAGILLAIIITLQNLPEGFNAYREMRRHTSFSASRIISSFTIAALFGPLMGFIGYSFLADQHSVVGAIMLFAAGGILYLIFQDIAPQVKLKNHWAPPLGAVAGFVLGMLGHMLL